MGKIQENLPHGSSRNKIDYLAERIDNFKAVYPLNRTAFMDFVVRKNDLDDSGRIQYLRYTNYSGSFVCNDLFKFQNPNCTYFGVGLAANAISVEEGAALSNQNGKTFNRAQQQALLLNQKEYLIHWEYTYVDSSDAGNYKMATIGSGSSHNGRWIVVESPAGEQLTIVANREGELFYRDNSSKIYINDDMPEPKIALDNYLEIALDNYLENTELIPSEVYYNACLFPFTLDFTLKVQFPDQTNAPTGKELTIYHIQTGGGASEHTHKYQWDDSSKTLEVYGTMTSCLSYYNQMFFRSSDYNSEYAKNGSPRFTLRCEGLDFSKVNNFNMTGTIAVHGAQPFYQGPM